MIEKPSNLNTIRDKYKPPYVAYRTFRTFIEFLRENEHLPNRIDRSVWKDRFSGSSGRQLMAALTALGLVFPDARPSEDLRLLVYGESQERRDTMCRILKGFYKNVFSITNFENCTNAQFHEAFLAYNFQDNVTAKCETFFIHAAKDAGIQLSSFIARHRVVKGKRSVLSKESTLSKQNSHPAKRKDTTASMLGVNKENLPEYPPFNEAWTPQVQKQWLEGYARIHSAGTRKV